MGQLGFVVTKTENPCICLPHSLPPLNKTGQIRAVCINADNAHTYSLNDSHGKQLSGIDYILLPGFWKTDVS